MLKDQFAEQPLNQDRWLVSYADLMTLLLAFFVVMYSIARLTEEDYKILTSQLSAAFAPAETEQTPGSDTVIDLGGAAGESSPATQAGDVRGAAEQQKTGQDIQRRFEGDNTVNVRGNEEWIELQLDSNLLFGSGGATLQEAARVPLAKVAEELARNDLPLRIEGFTDNVPVNGKKYASNWELSFARASAVLRFLAEEGITAPRMAAIGYGEFRPIADNSTDQGRAENRRVVIKMATNAEPLTLAPIAAGVDQAAPVANARTPAFQTIKLEGGGLLFTNSKPADAESAN